MSRAHYSTLLYSFDTLPPRHGPDIIAVKPTLAVNALDSLSENPVHVLQGEVFCS
jgi:hypothetical protein